MNWVRKLASKLRAEEPAPAQSKPLTKRERAAMQKLEKRIGYQFRDKELLEIALTHPISLPPYAGWGCCVDPGP